MFATNVNTGRIISTNTALYKRLKKLGETIDIAPAATPAPATPAPATPVTPIAPTPAPAPVLREKVIEVATDIIAENKKSFVGISQQDSDELLRKLLYEKLCITPKPKTAKAPPSKPSKKKKKKYIVSSSEEETDSD